MHNTSCSFINRAILKHNNIYDYSLIDYKNVSVKVDIICEEHGIFTQAPYKHIAGQGCPACAIDRRKKSLDSFILDSSSVHKNEYDYSLVKYINSNTIVTIICKKHGEFNQIPTKHIAGQKCPQCSTHKIPTTDEFISKLNLKFGDEYDYSLIRYVNNKCKIKIVCRKHGIFEQIPSNHLKGHGCPSCCDKKKLTTEEFINKSNVIHNYKYNYNITKYINHRSSLDIICEKHGKFSQIANYHLGGSGCPSCNKSKGETKIEILLKERNISYKTQFEFIDLNYKRNLKFDFVVFDKDDIKCLIEYNGIQHYIQNKRFHKDINEFELGKLKDNLKVDYCINNNIKLIILRYDDTNDYIEKIINEL